ncbi:MAG: hypothetical protein UW39_C0019G0002 [Parcubacteria group bacterium GW2011_GWC2_44_17]|uniref:Prepilin-type N-terminal cleavage/methylation domain-containing protein n=1 Tax=Candidatus Jacksonbacteria bacterium RIFCSPLOWO2_02_FULL_44_20 TaxID=1798460 RepID=A0A1G2AAQ0_9BACT|nr:MAG: hypothetical protein UW39_C0019G0002 [Parcubacteria group bacterium GW2011_GWC2_44_17]OGY71178.1 MAG: hypothetical protein A3C00_01250 [Candidatus Jacksonbacteria bacterium RIFCSPHIGHO2_02_FULL_44_25]OGY73921.1 MAG: hypothetical protein A3H61_01930 [Candidatus Jacksonbacteria bacterium RIFCSPLOWO2_02_FULL_44_20]OGY75028.1 MAG: hypothetical protein A3H07_03675 [Candidatus Jacksonbacteria bacterium RIFCSPLOWO2_12_FULL_44_15b]
MARSFKNLRDGFTLVELLVVIGIITVVGVSLSTVLTAGLKQQFFLNGHNESVEDARKAMRKMVAEIRETQDSDNGAYAVANGDAYELIFYSDIDTDIGVERVRYISDNSGLKKGVVEPSGANPVVYNLGSETITLLSPHVVNSEDGIPLFKYYTKDYPTVATPLATPVNIDQVSLINFVIRVKSESGGGSITSTLSSFVQPRNLKKNL